MLFVLNFLPPTHLPSAAKRQKTLPAHPRTNAVGKPQRSAAGLGRDSKPKKLQRPKARLTNSAREEIGYRDGLGVKLLIAAGSCTRTSVAW